MRGAAARAAILVLAALPEELRGLRRLLRGAARVGAPGGEGARRRSGTRGRIGAREVVLAATGDGAGNAAAGARAWLAGGEFAGVMFVGVAGGLSPGLRPGTVVAAREVIDAGPPVPPPDPEWLRRAERDAGALPASLVTSPEVLCTARAKAEAYARLPAGSVATVDLESAAYARAAALRGVPWVALRAVADAAEEELPLDFNRMLDRRGGIDRRRVALRALAHPALVAPLWRLKRRLDQGSAGLGRAAGALLAGGSA